MAKDSVKSVCEAGIRKGSGKGVIMNSLRKKFDKDDETYERSIKYYASALCRAGEIDEETKGKYVGTSGRKKAAAVSKKTTKSSKAKATKSKSKARTTTARKKTRAKSSAKSDRKTRKK